MRRSGEWARGLDMWGALRESPWSFLSSPEVGKFPRGLWSPDKVAPPHIRTHNQVGRTPGHELPTSDPPTTIPGGETGDSHREPLTQIVPHN